MPTRNDCHQLLKLGKVLLCSITLTIICLKYIELINSQQCPGRESEIEDLLASIEEQWSALSEKSDDKTQKLKEVNQEQEFNEVVKGIESH